jgi:hypothetical protein
MASAGPRLFWVVVFDRGRVSAPRAFTVREEAVVFATLQMAAERIEIVEAASADEAVARALGGGGARGR